MDRSASAAVVTELGKTANQPVHLVAIEFDEGWVYMCDGFRSIDFDGHTWTAVGHFLSFTDIEESATLQVARVTVALSGIDQTYVSAFLQEPYLDRQVKIYKAFMDADMALISDPFLIFDGRIDAPVIEEDPASGTSTVAVDCSDHWVDFERIPGRHTNHAEQQIYFPGDKGFEFADQIVKSIKWGRA
jgi:hypothetical protein